MFDITGTMWLVYIVFVYGLKSVWLPWLWPVFNQIFLMVYMSKWMRRSNVMTGAEWISTRFGSGRGAVLAHLSVVVFALVSVIGFLGLRLRRHRQVSRAVPALGTSRPTPTPWR